MNTKRAEWTHEIIRVEMELSALVPEVRAIATALLSGADVEEDATNAFLCRLMDLGEVATRLLPLIDRPANRRLRCAPENLGGLR